MFIHEVKGSFVGLKKSSKLILNLDSLILKQTVLFVDTMTSPIRSV